jgi:outer membrane protein OmpA-like peptidoglycan-associated protein
MSRKLNLTLVLVLLCTVFAWAQKEKKRVIDQVYDPLPAADEVVSKKYKKNHEDWKAGDYPFPGKPKDMWSIGLMAGSFYISGDVAGNFGLGGGLQVRKSLGYAASLRGSYFYGTTTGLNYKPQTNPVAIAQNNVLNSATGLGYKGTMYYNYKTSYHQASLDVLLNLNNILFHQRRNIVAPFVGAGLGLNMYTTYYDALDANGNIYESQFEAIPLPGDPGYGDRSTVRDALRDIMDGDYETLAEQNEGFNIQLGDNVLNPIVNLVAGIDFRLSKRLSLTIMHQATLTIGDDLVDGLQWSEQGDMTRQMDVPHFTSVGLNYALGNRRKTVEPKWFVNPYNEPAQKLQENAKRLDEVNEFLADDDKDGVPNGLDKEANTPAAAEVNVRGETLDSDGDGVPNHLDKEKFSPPGFPIDPATGVAQQPKYVTAPDVIKIADERYLQTDDCERCGGKGTLTDWFLPMIHFDLDKYAIKPDFMPELKYVASVMQKYPDLKIVVHGHTDVRNTDCYNEKLSFNRAQTAIDYLVNNFAISRERLLLKYGGEKENLVKNAANESGHYLNRRVEFSVATPTDKNMEAPKCDAKTTPAAPKGAKQTEGAGKEKPAKQATPEKPVRKAIPEKQPAGGEKTPDVKKLGKE